MIPGKFKALETSDEDSDSSDDSIDAGIITKEALEERVISQYKEALKLEALEKWDESVNILTELIESNLLVQVQGNKLANQKQGSLIHLKYCVNLNLGHALVQQQKLEEGLHYYLQASEIDDTDLTLWFKIGTIAVKVPNLNLAQYCFEQGLKCNPTHWPCLDQLITVSYALSDYLSCLYFISKALKLDRQYEKGVAFKRKILRDHRSCYKSFSIFYPDSELVSMPNCVNLNLNSDIIDEYCKEAILLTNKELAKFEISLPAEIKPLQSEYPAEVQNWIQISKYLLYLYQIAMSDDTNIFLRPVIIDDEEGYESPMEIEDDSELSVDSCERMNIDIFDDDGKRMYEKFMNSNKRRSSRFKSTTKREEPSLTKALMQLIPENLMPRDSLTDDNDVFEVIQQVELFKQKEKLEAKLKSKLSVDDKIRIIQEEGYFNTDCEFEDVKSFIKAFINGKYHIIKLLKELTLTLSEKWKVLWPDNLSKYYLRAFNIVLSYNNPATESNYISTLNEDLSIILFGELLIDKYLQSGKQKELDPFGESWLGDNFPMLYLGRIERQINHNNNNNNNLEIKSRIYWLESLLFIYNNEPDTATLCLQALMEDERWREINIKLPNIHFNNTITHVVVKSLMNALQRNKRLAKIEIYRKEGLYEEVIEILSESLTSECENEDIDDEVMSRSKQYAIILDTHWRLSHYKECIIWSEKCLNEFIIKYRGNNNEEERQLISETIVNCFKGMLSLIDSVGNIIFKPLKPDLLTRLIQSLTSVICLQLEGSECKDESEMSIETVVPWIILHHILKHDEECKGREIYIYDEFELPASLTILFRAHEYLGRRAWCCFDEGLLLFHSLNVIYPLMDKLSTESLHYATLNQQVEQIFYCLYGQIKKTKGRGIVDHNTLGLALTWSRAKQIYLFIKPKEIPSYDTYIRCTLTNDTESVYLKIASCVPDEINPVHVVPNMKKYIEGETDDVPSNCLPLPDEIIDLYYLLSAYYYKSKLWNRGIKYSILDLCTNSKRVDSWAGMALAKLCLIEMKINSCETIKSGEKILKGASSTLRCFRRALTLDPSQSTLWIEKGSFTYTIHSFCSNLMKKAQNLSLEEFAVLENEKEKMIDISFECFNNANNIWYNSYNDRPAQDERWLYEYMLGKIAEKKDKGAKIFIGHYLKSMELLNLLGPKFPHRISHNPAQYLSVEVLEIYYRVHASILKAIEKIDYKVLPETTLILFRDAVNKLQNSQFVWQQEINSSTKENLEIIQEFDETVVNNTIKKIKRSPSRSSLDEPSSKISKLSENKSATKTISTQPSSSSKSDDSSSDSDSDSSTSSSSDSSNSTSGSDSDSSSSSDSSDVSNDSSSVADEDEEENENKSEPKKQEISINWQQEQDAIVKQCLEALELCKQRFHEHYKSYFHLAQFYFKNKTLKDNDKVRELLLGINGLFADRKTNNFFSGIWRIPNTEIDRPGNFASHMGRCLHLLLDFLTETKDYKMLMEIAFHLKIVPEANKKFLRDSEREELCRESLRLSAQCLRKKVQEILDKDQLKSQIMEIYSSFKRINKCSMKEPLFAAVLSDAYCKIIDKPSENCIEAAVKFCQAEIAIKRQLKQQQKQIQSGITSTLQTQPPLKTLSNLFLNSNIQITPATASNHNGTNIITTTSSISTSYNLPSSTTILPAITTTCHQGSTSQLSSVSITPSVSVFPSSSEKPNSSGSTFQPTLPSSTSIIRSQSDTSKSFSDVPNPRGNRSGTTKSNISKRPRGRPPLSHIRMPNPQQFNEYALSQLQYYFNSLTPFQKAAYTNATGQMPFNKSQSTNNNANNNDNQITTSPKIKPIEVLKTKNTQNVNSDNSVKVKPVTTTNTIPFNERPNLSITPINPTTSPQTTYASKPLSLNTSPQSKTKSQLSPKGQLSPTCTQKKLVTKPAVLPSKCTMSFTASATNILSGISKTDPISKQSSNIISGPQYKQQHQKLYEKELDQKQHKQKQQEEKIKHSLPSSISVTSVAPNTSHITEKPVFNQGLTIIPKPFNSQKMPQIPSTTVVPVGIFPSKTTSHLSKISNPLTQKSPLRPNILSKSTSPTKQPLQTNLPPKSTLQTNLPPKSTLQTNLPSKSISQTNLPAKSTLQTNLPAKSTLQTNLPQKSTLASKSSVQTNLPSQPTLQYPVSYPNKQPLNQIHSSPPKRIYPESVYNPLSAHSKQPELSLQHKIAAKQRSLESSRDPLHTNQPLQLLSKQSPNTKTNETSIQQLPYTHASIIKHQPYNSVIHNYKSQQKINQSKVDISPYSSMKTTKSDMTVMKLSSNNNISVNPTNKSKSTPPKQSSNPMLPISSSSKYHSPYNQSSTSTHQINKYPITNTQLYSNNNSNTSRKSMPSNNPINLIEMSKFDNNIVQTIRNFGSNITIVPASNQPKK